MSTFVNERIEALKGESLVQVLLVGDGGKLSPMSESTQSLDVYLYAELKTQVYLSLAEEMISLNDLSSNIISPTMNCRNYAYLPSKHLHLSSLKPISLQPLLIEVM